MSKVDPRFRQYRWYKRVRPAVLARDGYRCKVVEGCQGTGDRVDHINPVHPGMTDAEFYDMRNLRAACNQHNLARYWADLLLPGTTPPPPRVHNSARMHGYAPYGASNRPVLLGGAPIQGAHSPNLPPRNRTIFGDYSRKPAESRR